MSTIKDMMRSMPTNDMDMDVMAMQECIEACSTASQVAAMCADADTGDDMARCCSMCMNTADVATTMMRMMLRPGGYDMLVMKSMLAATMNMGTACAEECRKHEDMHEHCRICAKACEAMVDACSRVMSGMPARR
jgi:hypothetical protein